MRFLSADERVLVVAVLKLASRRVLKSDPVQACQLADLAAQFEAAKDACLVMPLRTEGDAFADWREDLSSIIWNGPR